MPVISKARQAAHMPECNERCSGDSHWLQQSVPAPWQQAAAEILEEDEAGCE